MRTICELFDSDIVYHIFMNLLGQYLNVYFHIFLMPECNLIYLLVILHAPSLFIKYNNSIKP